MTQARPWTLVDLAALALRWRRWLVAVPVGVAAMVGIVLLVLPRQWSVTILLQPSGGGGSALGSLSGLAAQFGFRVPGGGEGGESPAFYVELLGTRGLLDPVAMASYTARTGDGSRTVPLAQWLNIGAADSALRLEQTVSALRRRVAAGEEVESGLVRITVRTRWPELSAAIGDTLVAALRRFNAEQRQTRARAERVFLEQRLALSRQELDSAEARLEAFLRRNRLYQNDPELLLAHDRVEREVLTLREVDSGLRQAYEQARLDEVRTPQLTVVQPPMVPASPDRRYLIVRVFGAAVVSLIVMFGLILVQAAWQAQAGEGIRPA